MNAFTLVVGAIAILMLAAAVWLLLASRTDRHTRRARERLREVQAEGVPVGGFRKPIRVPILNGVHQLLWRSGVEIEAPVLIRWVIGIVVVAVLLLVLAGVLRGSVIVAVLALIGGVILSRKASARRMQIIGQLPGFLENVVRILTAGNTLEEAFTTAAKENPDPIKQLFSTVSRQVRLGAPLEQVLADAGDVYRLRDLKVIALAVGTNRRYGGSIRNVFRSLVQTIRQRGTAAKELRALTAETRFSAMILAFVSVGLFAYVYLSNPGYYAQMMHVRTGIILLIASFALLVIGSLIIWRMTNSIGDADT